MTIAAFTQLALHELQPLYPEREIRSLVRVLLEHYGGFSSVQVHAFPDMNMEEDVLGKLQESLRLLKTGEPVQYVTGETLFCGLRFTVNRHVLIPRPETEELVYWAATELKIQKDIKIMDLCTGSGCIAISLAKQFPQADVSACDTSPGALAVARENAESNNVPVSFFEKDILAWQNSPVEHKYSLIISNPPYVRESERDRMHKNVLDFEPVEALFVPDDDPLVFYRAIAGFSAKCLFPDGCVLVEVNEELGRKTEQLFREYGFSEVTLRKDINGKDRMLRAKK